MENSELTYLWPKKPQKFLLKSGPRHLLLLLLFSTGPEVLARHSRQVKEIKSSQIEKEKVNSPEFTNDRMLHIENSKIP